MPPASVEVQLPKQGVLLQTAILSFGDNTREGQLITAVAIPWLELLDEIERAPDLLYQFARHPRKFEEFIAGAYLASGYSDVILTPRSADRGRDIIVTATLPGVGQVRFLDEIKAYSEGKKVTASDVSRLVWAVERDSATKGIVTTTSEFAPGVFDEFERLLPGRLELKDGPKLKAWLSAIAHKKSYS